MQLVYRVPTERHRFPGTSVMGVFELPFGAGNRSKFFCTNSKSIEVIKHLPSVSPIIPI